MTQQTVWLLLLLLQYQARAFVFSTNELLQARLRLSTHRDALVSDSFLDEIHGDTHNGCLFACQILSKTYPDITIRIPDDRYSAENVVYFSRQQSDVHPTCIFIPSTEVMISHALDIAKKTSCHFALKSGGHAAFEGASNARSGLTISMRNFNKTQLWPDERLATIGVGNRWKDVYHELEQRNLTVAGGRTGSIGVGGLILGGGLSFFSGLHGLSADNVANFRCILANGTATNANYTHNRDLYWALKGGGNNFAIITEVDMYTLPHHKMWGGIRSYTPDSTKGVIDAYVAFGEKASRIPTSSQITTLYYTNQRHSSTVDLYNTLPEAPSELLDTLCNVSFTSDTTAVRSQFNISLVNFKAQPGGFRQTYWTSTFKLNRELAHFVRHVFDEETAVLEAIRGLEARNIMQLITPNMVLHMKRNGGNPLGLADYSEPLMLLNPAFRWEDAEDDNRIMQAIMNFLNRVDEKAKSMGLRVPFQYMNYASQFQDVIDRYGSDNRRKLLDIAQIYDPDGIFQTLQPGYFKLNGRVGW